MAGGRKRGSGRWVFRAGWAALLAVFVMGAGCSAVHDGQVAYKKGNYQDAVAHWQPLANEGDARAQYLIGLMHERGHGVTKDDALAAQWYSRAAAQDHSAAMNNLGILYQAGRGVERDIHRAHDLYARASDELLPDARSNLGVLYL